MRPLAPRPSAPHLDALRLDALRWLVPVPAALLVAAPAHAQQVDTQAWLQTNVKVKVSDHWSGTLEGIARTSDRQGGIYTSELGAIVAWKPNSTIELGFGYRHVAFYNGNTGADENRLRQHVVLTLGRVTTRLRLDERFNPRGPEIGFRIRPLVRYNLPIGHKNTLFASHESFLLANDTSWGQRAGWERMRNIVGITLPLGSQSNIELGYLNQYRFGRFGARPQMDHALNVQVNLGFQLQHQLGD